MENLTIAMAGMTAVILFIFGLENFSREIENISGERFRKSLGSATRLPIVGVVIGALVTAVIQSSSATSVITISLVNAGVLTFKNSVGIIFGSNVGTTITAQLVAFKLTAFAPLIIILGFFLSLTRNRFSIFGKAIFYFGFVFFSLNLISSSLAPLQNNPDLIALLTQPQNPLIAILVGCLFTAMVQSSSVTTGLAIIFTQQGILGLENAVPLIMGANIGTTATAMIAVFGMDIAAKKTALCHFLFNVGGVLLFIPILFLFGHKLSEVSVEPALALANIHFIFNVVTSLIFIVLVTPFTRFVDLVLGEGKMDFERLSLPSYNESDDYHRVVEKLDNGNKELIEFLQENYNQVTLSLETNYKGIHDSAQKRIEYTNFLEKEYVSYFTTVVSKVNEEEQSKVVIDRINRYDYLFQIHDSIADLFACKRIIDSQFIELRSDIVVLIRELSNDTLSLFALIREHHDESKSSDIDKAAKELQRNLNQAQRKLLLLLADTNRKDAGALTNFVTYSQRLKDKLLNFHKISSKNSTEQ
ncbi:Na/Pi cotransporter family protein [Alteromonas sediminis]|uniref:Na/Pi cotransporter family protein n=1 Tax=Alteromonas sediminis TaxID=2259342 RepID=A0A3N5Y3I5_9ALTE|nr:Na/Pi symporter [Alteromonas sediminis]RPJ67376.1 Na/Pi cotransporter family protein [Alteromonas sediminis]